MRRDGQRIELTAKEYAVLEYLLSSPGRVFSRTMIIEHVWDQSFEGLTNIVTGALIRFDREMKINREADKHEALVLEDKRDHFQTVLRDTGVVEKGIAPSTPAPDHSRSAGR